MTVARLGGNQQEAYAYDGLGRRVRVEGASPSAWTVSVVSGMDAIYEEDEAGAVTKYVYANGMRVAKVTPSAAIQYYLGDHLGSTRTLLDANAQPGFAAEYEPFGKPYGVSGLEPYRYAMEKHDDPTGLVYLRARQYDPEVGRFVGADPILGHLGEPQTLNRYAYVANNPLRYTDPTGLARAIVAGSPENAFGGPCAWRWETWLNCLGSAWSNFESAVSAGGDFVICLVYAVGNPGCGSRDIEATARVTWAGLGLVSTALAPMESVPIYPVDLYVPWPKPVPWGAVDSSGKVVPNSYEAALMEGRLKPHSSRVFHEPFARPGQRGPDFLVVSGNRRIVIEATSMARGTGGATGLGDVGQLAGLQNYVRQGYGVKFFYAHADDTFLYYWNRYFRDVPIERWP